jgi:hypothetical protein
LLALVLSLSIELIEGRINVVGINGVHLGARLALTTVFLHFPKLEYELELLGSGYNADPTKDEMGPFWT